MTINTGQDVAANVRAELARRSISHREAARRLQYDQSAMSRRLRGVVEFTASELVALAQLLDVSVSDLVGETSVERGEVSA